MEIKVYAAMRAFIVHNGKILLIRESLKYESPNQGKYDVPGGKVKPEERFDDCLTREIKEETGLTVTLGKPFSVCEWRPVVKGIKNHIVGTFFECFADSPNVTLSESHDEYLWISPKEYNKYPLIKSSTKAFEDYLTFKKT